MKRALFFLLLMWTPFLQGENEPSLLEERASSLNLEMVALRKELKEQYESASNLFEAKAKEEEMALSLKKIQTIKAQIREKEKEWRQMAATFEGQEEESYGFWDQGETTLAQLIWEYGAPDFLYIIPHELGSMKIHMCSNIAIPKENWNEMIEMILLHNGIGIKKIGSFLRQVFILKHDLMNIEAVASSPEDLRSFSESAWIFYVFSAPIEQTRSLQAFFERFADPKQTTIQAVGNKIVLISSKESIQKLLEIYAAIWGKEQEKVVRVFSLRKMAGMDAEKILKSFFQEPSMKNRPAYYNPQMEDFSIIALPRGSAIVLVGGAELVEKAEKILKEMEESLQESSEMTIFWYTCKHSNPEELAHVLEGLFASLGQVAIPVEEKVAAPEDKEEPKNANGNNGYAPLLPISPTFAQATKQNIPKSSSKSNIVVDPKTGSLFMVVKKEELPKIQKLLEKLDVPKKMAQIDVMLVEKKLLDHSQTGINLFKIGTGRNVKETSLSFDTSSKAAKRGILDFILSRPKGVLPAFDLLASFLMAQEDLRINANPSVMAVNQTAATISIGEEISINNGAVPTETGQKYAQSYTRAQYGISISMTPTIHAAEEESEEGKGFITLQTNVTFDTTQISEDDRPPVTRRHIENEVRVADGETIILGGLKKNSDEESREKIPFLGEIPGIGKLFGMTKRNHSTTEMFIFITPHIVGSGTENLKKLERESLQRRPGDLPEFLACLEEARAVQKKKLFEKSLRLLWDRT